MPSRVPLARLRVTVSRADLLSGTNAPQRSVEQFAAKAQAAGGSGVAPPVEEMNHLLMGLVVGVQRSLHLLADRIEDVENRST